MAFDAASSVREAVNTGSPRSDLPQEVPSGSVTGTISPPPPSSQEPYFHGLTNADIEHLARISQDQSQLERRPARQSITSFRRSLRQIARVAPYLKAAIHHSLARLGSKLSRAISKKPFRATQRRRRRNRSSESAGSNPQVGTSHSADSNPQVSTSHSADFNPQVGTSRVNDPDYTANDDLPVYTLPEVGPRSLVDDLVA